jgi:predicted lipid-binding transport protein (Tim44 family)
VKKLLLLTFVFVFAVNAIGFAAVGGSKPRMSSPSRPSTTQTAPPPASSYKPSAPASSYTEKAPAAKAATPQSAQQTTSGGFMRNIGLLGGGMLLGGLLGNMFGFGQTGMFANLMGILFNILILAAAFMAGRYVWNKMTNRDRRSERK